MKISHTGALIAAAIGPATIGCAQIVTYNFDGDVATPSSVTSGIVASNFESADGGETFPNGASGDAISDNGWDTTLGDQYFQFEITVSNSFTASISSFGFNHRPGGSDPVTTFQIRTSTDGFSGGWETGTIQTMDNAAVKSADSFSGTGVRSVTLTGLTELTAGTTLSVRIGASGALSPTATLVIDDVEVYGSTSAVPEPSTCAALAGLVILGFASVRRRGRNAAVMAA